MKELIGEFHDAGDAVSIAVVVGAVSELLPPVAALLAIIWTLIRIYEWVRFRVFGVKSSEVFK